ncbi:serine/threonine-protein kinase [Microbacterium panaciterrae]|uniref:non-specific serine/threonine protein kinase n=1 Tax=Microbacterium panaciterrae TaxID=985759 RepID=A0ABP8P3I7_9MICO
MDDQSTAQAVRAAFDAATVEHLGSGTFGDTWKVDAVEVAGTSITCAVKLLRPEYFRAHLVEREVGGLREFDDPRIVKLHDVREISINDVTHTALICEYIPGGDVHANLSANMPTQDEVLTFAVGLLGAVSMLHKVDRVHRDLKLANVILRNGDWANPVLIDFGLSKGAGDATVTLYPSRIGSLPFMSPEQLAGEKARKASDLWACGVILYMALTQRHPYVDDFRGLSEDDIADLVSGPPRPLPSDTIPVLAAITTRLLSEEPFERGTASRAFKDLRKAAK